MKIYLLGSLSNSGIPDVSNKLRDQGYDVFDDWYSPGPDADEYWQIYEKDRGRGYKEAIQGYHAQHVFNFDLHHLDTADVAVMVLPCGRSAHLELGYARGKGKPAFVLFDGEPERYDIMYLLATALCFSVDELVVALKEVSNDFIR